MEFATFLFGSSRVRKAFLKYHRDLLDARFWQKAQESIRAGYLEDFFPYPPELRFCNQFPPAEAGGAPADEAALRTP